MIPKIIHYCWLSNDPYPEEIQRCINSWKKYLPEYEFIKWNFDRFSKEKSKWVSQAFDNKKYAFAADFIRLYAVYNYGGIYLDTDVEVVKPFDEFLNCQTMISWQDGNNGLEVAAFGAAKGEQWLQDCLSYYKRLWLKFPPHHQTVRAEVRPKIRLCRSVPLYATVLQGDLLCIYISS